MKFDFVIGNPPYQDETLGDYHHLLSVYILFALYNHLFYGKLIQNHPLMLSQNMLYPVVYPAKNFRDPKYNHGQHDKYEGAILRGPCDVKYFEDGKEKQVHLNNDGIGMPDFVCPRNFSAYLPWENLCFYILPIKTSQCIFMPFVCFSIKSMNR